MSCLLGDAGIAIGLTSLPFRHERGFYKNLAESLFPNYKKAVRDNFSPSLANSAYDSEFDDFFYKPAPYYLFGSFDLAVISLVDDFEMMARTFRPFDPMLPSPEENPRRQNFVYKVITGPTPQFRTTDSLVRLAQRTFLSEERPPLFAMSLLKLNNEVLLGTGAEFLRMVVRFVQSKAKHQRALTPNMQWLLLESYSANEITLLVFADNYASAAQLITSIRETRVQDLLDAELGESHRPAELMERCLLNDLATLQNRKQDVSVATLFADTESYFGFDFRLLNPEKRSSILDAIDPNDSLDLFCQWSVRPGHLHHSIQELVETKKADVSTCIGRGDLLEQVRSGRTRNVIEEVLLSLDDKSLPRHARRRQTIPALDREVISASAGINSGAEYEEPDLSGLAFSVNEITEIQDALRAIWAPKILTGKVLNAFTNFNDGILDPALYGYFVELLPLMELIQQTVSRWHAPPDNANLTVVCKTLEKIIDNFERGYRNRFYNSYRMGDISDFNLDFKGGVQQLLTSFDAAYKAICSVLGKPESFVYVAGSPGVYSTRYEVRLNYYHVFQPEIFGCIANHEAANSYLVRPEFQEMPWFARAGGLPCDGVLCDEVTISIPDRINELKNRATPDNAEILTRVTGRLFNYVFVDLLALYFGYNRNLHLFTHWYWGYYVQDSSHAYSRTEKTDETRFLDFMLRLMWIERISGIAPGAPLEFGMPSLDKKLTEWRPVLNEFLDWLWQDGHIARWNGEVLRHVESTFLDVNRVTGDETIEAICAHIDQEATLMSEKLERGEVCLYSKADDKSMFKFTEKIFYAYLRLLADRFGEGEILLDRSTDGRPKVKDSNAKALFDPIGGIFTHDSLTRRQRFRYRAGLTMSLWDMAQKEKKDTVVRRLKRKSPKSKAATSQVGAS